MKDYKKLREEFIEILRTNVNRDPDAVEDLINYLDNREFFTSPASTKYHGSYCGGLVQHSLDVYYSLIDELEFIYGKNWERRYSLESVTIVALLHDLCKIGRYVLGTRNVKDPETGKWNEVSVYNYNNDSFKMGHGSQSLYIVTKYFVLDDFEAQAIYWHMGAYDLGNYNTVSDLSVAYERNMLAFALHRADMIATYVVDNKYFEPIPLKEKTSEK